MSLPKAPNSEPEGLQVLHHPDEEGLQPVRGLDSEGLQLQYQPSVRTNEHKQPRAYEARPYYANTQHTPAEYPYPQPPRNPQAGPGYEQPSHNATARFLQPNSDLESPNASTLASEKQRPPKDKILHIPKSRAWLLLALVVLIIAALAGGLGGGLGSKHCLSTTSSLLTPNGTFTAPPTSSIKSLSSLCPAGDLTNTTAGSAVQQTTTFTLHCGKGINAPTAGNNPKGVGVSQLASVRALSLGDCLEDCVNWNWHWGNVSCGAVSFLDAYAGEVAVHNANCWLMTGSQGAMTDAQPADIVGVKV